MSYAFHYIKKILEVYLNDLTAKSRRRDDHCAHLCDVFLRCRQYNIRLNPHKCIFCVESGRLLDFIVSEDGIRVDPLKVEEILQFPSPKTIRQLQILQGKATFLRRFIVDYDEISKGFMRLLKQDSLFIWYEQAQHYFDAVKKSLVSTMVLSPPEYTRYFFLYLAETKSTLGMVLVQEDDSY